MNPIRVSSDALARLTALAPGGGGERSEAGHPFRSLIFGLDERLRRSQGIIEYCSRPDCVLRISMHCVRSRVVLVDGRLEPGEQIVDLHFLNEHLPGPGRGGLEQGSGLRRRLVTSFRALAAALESDPRLRDVKAVRGRMNSPFSRRPAELARFAGRFGLEPALQTEAVSLLQRARELGDDVWFCALTWAYSPETLGRRGVLRWRGDVWISRARLLERFRPR